MLALSACNAYRGTAQDPAPSEFEKFLEQSPPLGLVARRGSCCHCSRSRRIERRNPGLVRVEPCLSRGAALPAAQLRTQIHVLPFGMAALGGSNIRKLREKGSGEFL
jgi:hypothetical protein